MQDSVTTSKSLSILNMIFGIWLIISPYILTYSTAQAKWQQTVAGVIVLVLAGVRYFVPRASWASWINAIVGAWMIIAPFATNYNDTAAYWNEVIFGIGVLLVALWNASLHPIDIHHSGHHHAY